MQKQLAFFQAFQFLLNVFNGCMLTQVLFIPFPVAVAVAKRIAMWGLGTQ